MTKTPSAKNDPDEQKGEAATGSEADECPVELPCASTQSRLTVRQLEVLTRLWKTGSAGPAEEGKRLDLTLSSLVRRGLIRPTTADPEGDPDLYVLTDDGEQYFKPSTSVPERVAFAPRSLPERETFEELDDEVDVEIVTRVARYVPKPRDHIRFKNDELKGQLGCVRDVDAEVEEATVCVLAGRTMRPLTSIPWSWLDLVNASVEACDCQ